MAIGTAIPVAMAMAMLAFGCGGSNEEGGTASLEKAEYVKQVNAACQGERQGLRERVAEFERNRGDRRPEPYGDAVHFVLLPTIEEEVRRAEEVDPPPGDQERLDALFFAQRVTIDNVAVIPRVPSLRAAERRFAEAGRKLRAYGLWACAHGVEPPGRAAIAEP